MRIMLRAVATALMLASAIALSGELFASPELQPGTQVPIATVPCNQGDVCPANACAGRCNNGAACACQLGVCSC